MHPQVNFTRVPFSSGLRMIPIGGEELVPLDRVVVAEPVPRDVTELFQFLRSEYIAHILSQGDVAFLIRVGIC